MSQIDRYRGRFELVSPDISEDRFPIEGRQPMSSIAEKVAELKLKLPKVSEPVANYVSTRRSGDLLYISGQISRGVGEPVVCGLVGNGVSIEDGRRAASIAALHLLAQIATATDGLIASVDAVVQLRVFVASTPEFDRHSAVADGASDLLTAVLGDAGRHARTAIGVASLPAGATVELDAIVALAA